MQSIISVVLNDLIYHNLGMLKSIVKYTLGIDLDVMDPLCKTVEIRIPLVRRNGENHDLST